MQHNTETIDAITLQGEIAAHQRNIRASAELLRALRKHHDLADVVTVKLAGSATVFRRRFLPETIAAQP
jgi:hypothetical protein